MKKKLSAIYVALAIAMATLLSTEYIMSFETKANARVRRVELKSDLTKELGIIKYQNSKEFGVLKAQNSRIICYLDKNKCL